MSPLRFIAISVFLSVSLSAQANQAMREFASNFVPIEIFRYAPNGDVICLIEGFQMYEFMSKNGKVFYSTSERFPTEARGAEEWRHADALVICRDREFVRLQVFDNE